MISYQSRRSLDPVLVALYAIAGFSLVVFIAVTFNIVRSSPGLSLFQAKEPAYVQTTTARTLDEGVTQ